MMNRLLSLLPIHILLLVSCTTAQQMLLVEQDAITHSNAILLYEHTFVGSGATGDCASTFVTRWYGSRVIRDTVSISGVIGDQLSSEKWAREGTRWRKDNKEGAFFAEVNVFPDTSVIDPVQAYYVLPSMVLHELSTYPTAYVLTMNHVQPSAMRRCFE